MRDYIVTETTPYDEPCAQLGSDHYATASLIESGVMRGLLIRTFGELPASVTIRRQSNPHDYGAYYDLKISYDPSDPVAVAYITLIDTHYPARWDEAARHELAEERYTDYMPEELDRLLAS